MMTRRKHRTKSPKTVVATATSTLPTFMDHVREAQGRLFMIVLAFLAVGGAAFPFFDKIVNVIVAPLGRDQELVYLTPSGAFGFMIQVCIYVGIIGALPVIIYQLYRFIMPAVEKVNMRRALGFTLASFFLAIVGIVFAYSVILPAALYFLTSFDLYHINPMLTIDSYFSFVMTYLLAGALLFQLPLVMLMIDQIRPLKPSKLMKHQDKMLVGSFIVAAVISPTPDALNQSLLASPLVVMYQIGIIIIWAKHRKEAKRARSRTAVCAEVVAPPALPAPTAPAAAPHAVSSTVKQPALAATRATIRSVDGFVAYQPAPPHHRAMSQVAAPRQTQKTRRPLVAPQRQQAIHRMPQLSVDGFYSA